MPSTDSKREKAREVVDILEEISILLVMAISHNLLDSTKNWWIEHTAWPYPIVSLCVVDWKWCQSRSSGSKKHPIFWQRLVLKYDQDSNQRAETRHSRFAIGFWSFGMTRWDSFTPGRSFQYLMSAYLRNHVDFKIRRHRDLEPGIRVLNQMLTTHRSSWLKNSMILRSAWCCH